MSKLCIYFFHCWAISLASLGFVNIAHAHNIAHAQNSLAVFDNNYKAKLYGFSIDVTSRLTTIDDDNYEFYFKADSAIGSVTEVSKLQWNVTEQTVKPYHYSYKRRGVGKSKEDEIGFNWVEHTVDNLKTNKSLPFDSASKIQDNLSYQLQMRQDLIAGKNNFEYAITNGRKFKKYRFEVVGEEVLQTPLGDVKTVKVKRSDANNQTVIHAWFAPSFQHLLVQLQQEENGSAYTIYLSKAVLNGKAIEHF